MLTSKTKWVKFAAFVVSTNSKQFKLTAAYKWNTIKIHISFWIQKCNVQKTNVNYCIQRLYNFRI